MKSNLFDKGVPQGNMLVPILCVVLITSSLLATHTMNLVFTSFEYDIFFQVKKNLYF